MADKPVRTKEPKRAARRTTARKAPTREVTPTRDSGFAYTHLIVVFVFLLVIGGSVAVGFTDSGQINVSGAIEERRSNATPEELAELEGVTAQRKRPDLPDGGLVPTTNVDKSVLEAPKETGTTTATSTDETASSTESDLVEEESEGESEETVPETETTEETSPAEQSE